jgi:hypothetical protein
MDALFLSKQITETLVIKDGEYRYIAQCVFTKNGKKQIWEYTSINNKRTYTRLL